jgi:hypothetical protein
MYLAIMLIVVAVLVFYNEINSKMNIAEIALLAVALIAIIRASLNYINMSDTITTENFTNNTHQRNTRSRKNGVKARGKHNKNDATIDNTFESVLDSSDSSEYFDTTSANNKSPQDNTNTNANQSDGKISHDAVNQINSLLGISKFADLPTTTQANATTTTNPALPTNTNNTTENSIDSVFRPQIIIGGKNNSSNGTGSSEDGSYGLFGETNISNTDILQNVSAEWKTSFSEDSMTFPNTMSPSSNLWGTPTSFGEPAKNDSNAWTQSMNDYNNGRWNPQLYQRPSDYTDYYTPSAYGMNTPPSNTTPSNTTRKTNSNSNSNSNTSTEKTGDTAAKRCGVYDDLSLDQAGNLVVRNYTEAKKWYPGYTYVPPVYWDVPQRHTSVCQPTGPNYTKLTGLVDRGLPINVLELNADGTQADTEDTVKMSNVGSMMPRFNYQEMPFSKPYV